MNVPLGDARLHKLSRELVVLRAQLQHIPRNVLDVGSCTRQVAGRVGVPRAEGGPQGVYVVKGAGVDLCVELPRDE